ncbi:hypothetical protein GQ53DRAFT_93336 [Thozetella sp. PMI_491]|nr:hypothetical protein GQ53DRAFT_93336 [Thozetella sp. PMI_491]
MVFLLIHIFIQPRLEFLLFGLLVTISVHFDNVDLGQHLEPYVVAVAVGVVLVLTFQTGEDLWHSCVAARDDGFKERVRKNFAAGFLRGDDREGL